MADQKINELPTKTAPSTGDKMLMIGAAEEYQIDYDQLATAILNKLSTQSFSSLDTTSKTVLGAIDELNSKTLNGTVTYSSLSDIPVQTMGIYGLSEDIRPDPAASNYMGFCLGSSSGNARVLFIIRPYTKKIYINSYQSGAWSGWDEVSGTSL